jgi:hypothetical protein
MTASIKMTEMLELSDKTFKVVIMKMLQQAVMNMLEIMEHYYLMIF